MNRNKMKRIRIRAEYLGKPDPRLDYVYVDVLRDALASLKMFASTPFTYSQNDQTAALQHWFTYLAALIAMSADSVAMLALNQQSLSAFCLQRQVVEYVAKALYFEKHPEEAWYQFHYAAKDKLSFLRDQGLEGTDEYARAQQALEEAIGICPPVALSKKERRPVGIADIMEFHGEGRRELYANVFRYPSLLLHANPLGMALLYEKSESTSVRPARFQMRPGEINALLLDLAGYIISFGIALDRQVTEKRFENQWQRLEERFLHVQRRFITRDKRDLG